MVQLVERPAGLEPAPGVPADRSLSAGWVHFVRSEGHQSSLARTLKTLVGELRIELSPRAPKARMQRITPFPDGASSNESIASLKFSAERIDRAYATGESGGPGRLCPDRLRIASAALCLNEL